MQFDPVGMVLFVTAIVCLLLALQWGGVMYQWSSGRIITLFTVCALSTMGFFLMQHRQQENATVPPRLIANRTIWAGGLYAFCIGSSFFLPCMYLPIWFQAVQGTSAVDSGIRNLPMLLTVVALTTVGGVVVTSWGYYAPYMLLGTACMAVGAGLLSTLTPRAPASAWAGYQALFGAGVGLGIQQPLMAVQTVLRMPDVAAGTALMVFLQSLGGAVFVSVGNSIFTNQLAHALAVHVPALDPGFVVRAGATNLQKTLPPELLPPVVLAYNESLTKTFLVAAALGALSIVGSAAMPWNSVKEKKAEAGIA